MNTDYLVYVQKAKDGIYKVWHAHSSITPPEDRHCIYTDTFKDTAVTAAKTYVYGTEYSVHVLPDES